jgi:uncharacterized protein (DUF1330 family)
MTAYIVSQYDLLPEYDAYRKQATALNLEHDARVITVSGTEEVIEGNWPFQGLTIIQFKSVEHAREFIASEPYKAVKALRADAPPLTIVLVDGDPAV